jgi:hypothetical protein
LKALEGPPCFTFHAEAWLTPEDEIVFCEIGSRTGGGEIGWQMVELFEINLDKTSTQGQCENFITNETIATPWYKRPPSVPYSIAWIWMYESLSYLFH